jgi:hypothetical protein
MKSMLSTFLDEGIDIGTKWRPGSEWVCTDGGRRNEKGRAIGVSINCPHNSRSGVPGRV